MSHMDLNRRSLLAAPLLLAAVAPGMTSPAIAHADPPNPEDTFVVPLDQMSFEAWGNLPRGSGEMASLYGDLNEPGPYLVTMRSNPGW
jgi:hypothetical protein